MQRTTHTILTVIVGTAMFMLAAHGVWAHGLAADRGAQAGDPARWYLENTTPRERFDTSKKEAGAAYRQAKSNCKKASKTARAECMQNARNTYGRDMIDARQEIGAARS